MKWTDSPALDNKHDCVALSQYAYSLLASVIFLSAVHQHSKGNHFNNTKSKGECKYLFFGALCPLFCVVFPQPDID